MAGGWDHINGHVVLFFNLMKLFGHLTALMMIRLYKITIYKFRPITKTMCNMLHSGFMYVHYATCATSTCIEELASRCCNCIASFAFIQMMTVESVHLCSHPSVRPSVWPFLCLESFSSSCFVIKIYDDLCIHNSLKCML